MERSRKGIGKIKERQWKVKERPWKGQGKAVERAVEMRWKGRWKGSGKAKERQWKVKERQWKGQEERQWEGQGKAVKGQGKAASYGAMSPGLSSS